MAIDTFLCHKHDNKILGNLNSAMSYDSIYTVVSELLQNSKGTS